jgi:hypothetical protein
MISRCVLIGRPLRVFITGCRWFSAYYAFSSIIRSIGSSIRPDRASAYRLSEYKCIISWVLVPLLSAWANVCCDLIIFAFRSWLPKRSVNPLSDTPAIDSWRIVSTILFYTSCNYRLINLSPVRSYICSNFYCISNKVLRALYFYSKLS